MKGIDVEGYIKTYTQGVDWQSVLFFFRFFPFFPNRVRLPGHDLASKLQHLPYNQLSDSLTGNPEVANDPFQTSGLKMLPSSKHISTYQGTV